MKEEHRPLGPAHVAAVVVGAIVGVGIFFTPGTLARALPSPTWVLGVWILGGFASLAGALVFADLGAKWSRAGGVYVFLREGWPGAPGALLSFLYGFLQLVVVQPGAMAVIALVLVDNATFVAGPVSPTLRSACACLAILAFTATNLLGLRAGGRIQLAVAGAKIGALALLVVLALVFGRAGHVFSPAAVAPSDAGWFSWLLFGLIPVLFTFGGAYHGTFIAGAVREPERSVPRGIVLGVTVVLVAYLAANVAYLALLGQRGLASSTSPAADAVAIAIGPVAAKVVALAIVISAAGILNTICLGFPFVVYAMAQDGVFFGRAGRLDPRTGRPAFAVAVQGGVACLAVIAGASRIDVLLTGIAFADAVFHAAVAIIHLRHRARAQLAAIVFLVVEVGVGVGCLVRAPAESGYGAGALIAGAILWTVWRRAWARS